MLREIRPYVRSADLAICHVETPMSPRPPEGYPVFNTPPQLARAIRQTGWQICDTASNHSVDQGQYGIDQTGLALDRAGVLHTGSFSSRAAQRRTLIVTVKGVQGRVSRVHRDDQRDPAAPPVVGQHRECQRGPSRGAHSAPARRTGRDRQLSLGHRVSGLAQRVPAGHRASADQGSRHHRDRRPARPRRATDPARERQAGRLRRRSAALQPVSSLLFGADRRRDARVSPYHRRPDDDQSS